MIPSRSPGKDWSSFFSVLWRAAKLTKRCICYWVTKETHSNVCSSAVTPICNRLYIRTNPENHVWLHAKLEEEPETLSGDISHHFFRDGSFNPPAPFPPACINAIMRPIDYNNATTTPHRATQRGTCSAPAPPVYGDGVAEGPTVPFPGLTVPFPPLEPLVPFPAG